MKHKYVIQKHDNDISVKEYAEIDKDVFLFACEEKYDINFVQSVSSLEKKTVLSILRTANFFPPGQFVERIAHAITTLLTLQDQDSLEILCDDETLLSNAKEKRTSDGGDDDVETLDDFIEDDDAGDNDFDDALDTRNGVASIKIDVDSDDDADQEELP